MIVEKAHRSIPSWCFLGIFLVCTALIKPVQDGLESRLGTPGQEPDLLYFSSPAVLKRLALGYEAILADFYWMRTIQYYGRRDEADKRPIRYKNLATLLDITTTLDSGLLDAYRAGSLFLAEPDPVGAGQTQEALKLLDKGIHAFPKDWKLYYDKGFIYYLYSKDYKAAGEVWQAASRLEGAPPWMAALAAMSLTKGGTIEIALGLWQQQYRESTRADVRENARNHLLSFEIARDIWSLEYLAGKYWAKNGSFAASLRELVGGKENRYRIADPMGFPYRYNTATGEVSLSPESTIKYLEVPESYKPALTIKE